MTVYTCTTLFNIVQQTSLHRKSFFHKNKRKKSEYGNFYLLIIIFIVHRHRITKVENKLITKASKKKTSGIVTILSDACFQYYNKNGHLDCMVV
jgi:hypothetical protein